MVALIAYCLKSKALFNGLLLLPPVARRWQLAAHSRSFGVMGARSRENRHPTPSAASIDSQTVPTAVMVDETVGDDAGKKIKGRKRFTVDTLGLLIAVRVVAANTPERQTAKQLLNQLNQNRDGVPRRTSIWVDAGFSGQDFLYWLMNTDRWVVKVVLRPQGV